MEENSIKIIEKLADKLGTTSEYLFSVLVAQAPIDSTITIIQTILIVIYGIMLYRINKRLVANDSYDDILVGIPMFLGVGLFLVLVVCTFFSIPSVINGYFNPEYWALEEILSTFKN